MRESHFFVSNIKKIFKNNHWAYVVLTVYYISHPHYFHTVYLTQLEGQFELI